MPAAVVVHPVVPVAVVDLVVVAEAEADPVVAAVSQEVVAVAVAVEDSAAVVAAAAAVLAVSHEAADAVVSRADGNSGHDFVAQGKKVGEEPENKTNKKKPLYEEKPRDDVMQRSVEKRA